MSKRMITRWWLWGLLAFFPAAVLIPSSALALAAHLEDVTPGTGSRFVGDGYAWTMVGLIVLGAVFAAAGAVAQFVAWIGAVRNTRRLDDDRWFNALLWCGIIGIIATPLFGVGTVIAGGVMLAYLVAGPDGTAVVPAPTTPPKATIVRWARWGFAAAGAALAVSLVVANLTNRGRPLHGLAWPALALESAGFALVVAGAIVVYAAWWAAVFNTQMLADKAWFTRLLWGGIAATLLMPLFGLGALVLAAVMIPYGLRAPDGLTVAQPQLPVTTASPRTLAATPGHG